MKAKSRKLQKSLKSLAKSCLFQSLNFYLDGFLDAQMTNTELKVLIASYGAAISESPNKKTTHILATQMTRRKMTLFKCPVVTPNWVYDCIEAKRLLNLDSYRLFQPALDPKQKELKWNHAEDIDELVSAESDSDHLDQPIDPKHKSYPRKDLDYNNDKIRLQLCTAPGFLANYFSSSRLHHLSTWKGELVERVSKEMINKNKRPRKNNAVIMHVDMDCFFASVALRDRRDLVDKPVVIAHNTETGDANSTSEIASCNYVARGKGIKNGSYLGTAYSLAGDTLVVLKYDFASIQECTNALYRVVMENSDFVQAVSCDEVLLDVTSTIDSSPLPFSESCIDHAEKLRRLIFQETGGCPASVGIGINLLTARLATHRAKPNGVFAISHHNLFDIMQESLVGDLPGVGWNIKERLKQLSVETCGQLQELSNDQLKEDFGGKLGETLYHFSRGKDDRILENKLRQSVGAEVNWAVRFLNQTEVYQFMKELSDEVYNRMKSVGLLSRHLTLHIKQRNYEGEPSKFLGCGHCIDHSKSFASNTIYQSADAIFRNAYDLLTELQLCHSEIRGIGIHLKQQQKKVLKDGQRTISFSGAKIPQIVQARNPRKRKSPAEYQEWINSFEKCFGIHPEKVDIAVFTDLPQEIQNEMIAEGFEVPSKTKNFQDEHFVDVDITFSQIDPTVWKHLPRELKLEQKSYAEARKKKKILEGKMNQIQETVAAVVITRKRPNLAGDEDVTSVQRSLEEWARLSSVQSTPYDDDVVMISEYLKSLVLDLKMDLVVVNLRILARTIFIEKDNVDWIDAFNLIYNAVDDCIFRNYGSRMAKEILFGHLLQ